MENKAKTRTEQILTMISILTWIAFIGFMIEAGAILVSYVVSCVNPEGAKDLYKGLNLYDLRHFNFWYYTLHVSFMAVFPILKSYVLFLLIKIVSKINLANPFSIDVANKLEKISYVLFGIWLVSLLNTAHSGWLSKLIGGHYGNEASGEFIFMAGLVFIISQIFKRGVEIQTENELTV